MSTLFFRHEYITPRRLAEILNISPAAVRYWIQNNPNIALKIGGRYYIPLEHARQIIRGVPLPSVGTTPQRENTDDQSETDEYSPGKTEFVFA